MIEVKLANKDYINALSLLRKSDLEDFLNEPVTMKRAQESVQRYFAKGCDMWLAYLHDMPRGFAIGLKEKDSYMSLWIYVNEEARNQGIGIEMKVSQVVYAWNLGCREIYTSISQHNKGIVRVHEKAGFEFQKLGSLYYVSKKLSI